MSTKTLRQRRTRAHLIIDVDLRHFIVDVALRPLRLHRVGSGTTQNKLSVHWEELTAAEQEFAVVFPEYYFGQIFEAKHQPGTVAYSRGLQLQLLQETTDEMARNGCKKVIIVNGHGGNNSLLPYFAQSQLESPHDYVV